VLLRYDGSVINEETAERDPNLDIYNPANGYVPGFGADSIYTPEFLVSYYAAQCARMNAKIDAAQARLAAIQAGGERFTDNDWFIVPAIRAYPAYTDFDVNRATDAAFLKLPSGDTEVVVRQSITLGPFRAPQNRSTGGARVHTLTGFLALRAIRCGNTHPESHATMPFNPEGVTPETSGIDWDSTNNTAVGNLIHVSVPTLIVQGMADTSIYPRSAELIYNAAAATDKTLIFIEGATHSFTTAGGFDIDVPAVTVQALTDWLRSRFP
jgi:pimeloyl-ACP methyl ester carboxylesterase